VLAVFVAVAFAVAFAVVFAVVFTLAFAVVLMAVGSACPCSSIYTVRTWRVHWRHGIHSRTAVATFSWSNVRVSWVRGGRRFTWDRFCSWEGSGTVKESKGNDGKGQKTLGERHDARNIAGTDVQRRNRSMNRKSGYLGIYENEDSSSTRVWLK